MYNNNNYRKNTSYNFDPFSAGVGAAVALVGVALLGSKSGGGGHKEAGHHYQPGGLEYKL